MTPMKDARAMVMVATGPATAMPPSICCAKRVGSQFLVAQPGSEVEAKKNRITQKAMLLKMRPKDFRMDWPGFVSEAAALGARFSLRQNTSTTAYSTPMTPNHWKVIRQLRADAKMAPKPPTAWPR